MVLFCSRSGAGKTSLVNAGVIPLLEEEGFQLLSGRVAGIVPEQIDPDAIKNLYVFNAVLSSSAAAAAAPEEFLQKSLGDSLRDGDTGRETGGEAQPRALILDQFEEFFTVYPRYQHEREEFVEQLGSALHDDPLLRIVLVLREEYVPHLDRYSRLLPEWPPTSYRIERLRRTAALQAIEAPLARSGRSFSPGVAEALADDLLKVRVSRLTERGTEVVEVAGEFVEPVHLQVACQRLWSALPRTVKIITHERLRASGAVDTALTEFYEDAIRTAHRETHVSERALRMWCGEAMITPLQTRGRVPRGERDTAGMPNDAVEVLEREHLIRAEQWSRAPWYELTHDRLIAPIVASNELEETELQRRRRPALAGLMLCLLLLCSVVWTVDRQHAAQQSADELAQQRLEVERQTRVAQSRQLAARVPGALDRDAELGLLLAMEAISVTYSVDSSYTVEAYAALWQALDSPPYVILRGHTGSVNSACFDSQGQQVVTASADKTARVWDLGGATLATLEGHKAPVLSARFSPDARYIVTASEDSTARLWGANGDLIAELSGHDGPVNDAVFAPPVEGDPLGELILTAGADGTARVWDIGGNPIATLSGHTGPVNNAVFNSAGDLIITASADGTARLWTPEGTPIATLAGHTASLNHAEFSPDGALILTASADGTARLWDLTGRSVATISGHTKAVSYATFSPDGERVVTASADGTARLWNLQGRPVVILAEHGGPINHACFSPDGLFVATASGDGTVRLWHRDGQALGTLSGRNAEALHAVFSPDGHLVVAGKAGGAARLHYLSVDQMMALARSRVTRSLTAEELELYGGAYKVLIPTPTCTSVAPSPTPLPSPTAPTGMVLVPGGSLLMGSTQEDVDLLFDLCSRFVAGCKRESLEDQLPQRSVSVDSFYIDVFEVTNAQYAECVEAAVCRAPEDRTSLTVESYYSNPAYYDYPVIRVNWFDAQTYCEWAGKRLPTEAEWEKAAGGVDGRMYPWGNQEPDATRLNYCDAGCWKYFRDQSVDDGYADTSPVGTYPMGVSPYSVCDMSGNVWEWVADWYGSDYYLSGPVSNPTGPSQGSERVIRGGSFENSRHVTSVTYRSHAAPDVRTYLLGFRCAASAQ